MTEMPYFYNMDLTNAPKRVTFESKEATWTLKWEYACVYLYTFCCIDTVITLFSYRSASLRGILEGRS